VFGAIVGDPIQSNGFTIVLSSADSANLIAVMWMAMPDGEYP
jgi:hypothetical protein